MREPILLRQRMRFSNWAFRTMDGVGILKLDWHFATSVCQLDLCDNGPDLSRSADRIVAAFFAAIRCPAKVAFGIWVLGIANGVFHIWICACLLQFMVQRCDDILPWFFEHRNSVG